MEKEAKKAGEVTPKRRLVEKAPDNASVDGDVLTYASTSSTQPGIFRELGREVKEQVRPNKGYLTLDYFTLFWIFTAGCIFGLVVETIFHAIVYGNLESRAGLMWGPFSPIYGVGAVLLTTFLNRFYHSHNLIVFLVAMVLGSCIEYAASLIMQYLWGAIAWDYTGTFGSINGRTNFAFGVMWGMLGLVWARIIMPFIKRVFSHVNSKAALARTITAILTIFLALDIVVTVLALDREGERASGIQATTWEQGFFDEYFPDSYMQARFQNMSVYGKD